MSGSAEHMRAIAKRGGQANKAKHGDEYFREIGAMGGRAGKGKRKKKPAAPNSTTVAPSVKPMLDTLDSILAELERPRT